MEEKESNSEVCAVCFDTDFPIIPMPCCNREGSSTNFCRRCMELICSESPFGMGRCPNCRATVGFKDGTLVLRTFEDKCSMCRHHKIMVDLDRRLCSDCSFGSVYNLRYECNGCHKIQRIPHPMWRYQEKADTYGSSSWACHQRCGDYTHWRVIPDDLERVPSNDIPASWGRDEDFLDMIRQHRLAERNDNSLSSTSSGPTGCVIV